MQVEYTAGRYTNQALTGTKASFTSLLPGDSDITHSMPLAKRSKFEGKVHLSLNKNETN